MEGAPFLEKGKLYVPLRPLLTGMGIEEEEINYRAKEGSVEIAWQGKKIWVYPGLPYVNLGGEVWEMSVPSLLREARVWVPLRDFCQLLSWHVFWYGPADTFPAVAGASPFSISSMDEGEIREISRKAANMAMEAFRQTSQNAAEEVLAEKAIYFPDTPGSRNNMYNVRLAAHQINGTVLAPEQVFSPLTGPQAPGQGRRVIYQGWGSRAAGRWVTGCAGPPLCCSRWPGRQGWR